LRRLDSGLCGWCHIGRSKLFLRRSGLRSQCQNRAGLKLVLVVVGSKYRLFGKAVTGCDGFDGIAFGYGDRAWGNQFGFGFGTAAAMALTGAVCATTGVTDGGDSGEHCTPPDGAAPTLPPIGA